MTRFLIKTFDTEAVVFDVASGDTHYLSPLAFTLFHHTQAGLVSEDIPHTLAHAMKVQRSPEFERHVSEMVTSLQRIGLIGLA